MGEGMMHKRMLCVGISFNYVTAMDGSTISSRS